MTVRLHPRQHPRPHRRRMAAARPRRMPPIAAPRLAAPRLVALGLGVVLAAALAGASAANAGARAREAADKALGMAILSATVAPDGVRVRDSGLVAAEWVSTGTFRLTFARPITACTCTATAGANNVNAAINGVFAAANCPYYAEDAAQIVTTVGTTKVDAPFHVIVFCPR